MSAFLAGLIGAYAGIALVLSVILTFTVILTASDFDSRNWFLGILSVLAAIFWLPLIIIVLIALLIMFLVEKL